MTACVLRAIRFTGTYCASAATVACCDSAQLVTVEATISTTTAKNHATHNIHKLELRGYTSKSLQSARRATVVVLEGCLGYCGLGQGGGGRGLESDKQALLHHSANGTVLYAVYGCSVALFPDGYTSRRLVSRSCRSGFRGHQQQQQQQCVLQVRFAVPGGQVVQRWFRFGTQPNPFSLPVA